MIAIFVRHPYPIDDEKFRELEELFTQNAFRGDILITTEISAIPNIIQNPSTNAHATTIAYGTTEKIGTKNNSFYGQTTSVTRFSFVSIDSKSSCPTTVGNSTHTDLAVTIGKSNLTVEYSTTSAGTFVLEL